MRERSITIIFLVILIGIITFISLTSHREETVEGREENGEAVPVIDPVECIFLNSDTEEECYPSSHGTRCSGTDSCEATINYWGTDIPEHNISSDIGEEIIWMSSCEENVSMIIGEHERNEELVFNCE